MSIETYLYYKQNWMGVYKRINIGSLKTDEHVTPFWDFLKKNHNRFSRISFGSLHPLRLENVYHDSDLCDEEIQDETWKEIVKELIEITRYNTRYPGECWCVEITSNHNRLYIHRSNGEQKRDNEGGLIKRKESVGTEKTKPNVKEVLVVRLDDVQRFDLL